MRRLHRILIIHKSQHILDTFRVVLEYEGYSVDLVQSIEEGLDLMNYRDYSAVIADKNLELNEDQSPSFQKGDCKIFSIADWYHCPNGASDCCFTTPFSAEEIIEKINSAINPKKN